MNEDVDRYIARQESPQREILQELRQIILSTFPEINEEMKLGVPWYEGRFYLVGLKKHVNLGVAIKGLTKDEIALFEGAGKITRHLKIVDPKDIDEAKIIRLLKLIKPQTT